VGELEEFAIASSKPLEEAARRSADTIERLNTRVSGAMETLAVQVAADSGHLSKSTSSIIKAIDGAVSKLISLQTPEQIIEIKLNPMVQGLSRAVNNFGKHAETQAKAVDANLKQTQELLGAITTLLSELRTRPSSPGMPAAGANPPGAAFPQPSPGRLDR
jgi:hypothetical protein